MRTHAKTDANQTAIVKKLLAAGFSVQSLATIGDGCPDILVGLRLRNWLFEIKNPEQPPSERKLTPMQAEWHRTWKGQVHVIETVEEALEIVNGTKQSAPATVTVTYGHTRKAKR